MLHFTALQLCATLNHITRPVPATPCVPAGGCSPGRGEGTLPQEALQGRREETEGGAKASLDAPGVAFGCLGCGVAAGNGGIVYFPLGVIRNKSGQSLTT